MYRYIKSASAAPAGGLLGFLYGAFRSLFDGLRDAGIDYEENKAKAEQAQKAENAKAQKEGRKPTKITAKFLTLDLVSSADNSEHTADVIITPADNQKFWGQIEFENGKIFRTSQPKSMKSIEKWMTERCDAQGYGREDSNSTDVDVDLKLTRRRSEN